MSYRTSTRTGDGLNHNLNGTQRTKILSGEARECRATGFFSGVWPEHSSIPFDFFEVARSVAVCEYTRMYCRSTEVQRLRVHTCVFD